MSNTFLYIVTVLIWGSTWLAIEYQLGVVEPDDLAQMAVYLASPAAARLTGQAISINGGISAG